MRFAVLTIAASLIAAAPALAREPARMSPEQAARALESPVVQEVAARALTQLVGIVLDTRVGPAAALDPSVRPNDTLRDLARRDDPQFEERLYRDTKRTLGTAAVVAGGAMAQAREIERTADRLEAALSPLLGALGGGDRDGY